MGGLSDFMSSIADPLGIIDFAKDEYAANRDEKNTRATLDTQMAFGERMSNTAYQRAVTDMQAAGLNPMLAYSQGGAHTPGMPSSPSFNHPSTSSGSLHSAAQVQNLRANTELVKAQKAKVIAETGGAQATSTRLQKELEGAVPYQVASAEMDFAIKEAAAYWAQVEKEVMVDPKDPNNLPSSRLIREYFEAKFKMVPAEVRAKLAEVVLKELAGKVGREADRGYESFKRGAGDLGEKLGKVTNSAVDAVRAMKHGYERFHSRAQYRRKYEFGH